MVQAELARDVPAGWVVCCHYKLPVPAHYAYRPFKFPRSLAGRLVFEQLFDFYHCPGEWAVGVADVDGADVFAVSLFSVVVCSLVVLLS